MKISVIIPVYNVERYLARCLDSVFAAADGLETEIICVNDGSTDGSAKILERYLPRIRIVTKENGGLGSARNAGLDIASGEYLLFVDSDDYLPPNGISSFVRVAEESQAKLVVSSSFLKDDGSGSVKFRRGDSAPRWRLRNRDWVSGRKIQYCAWNKFYHRDLWNGRRFPATVFEDFPVTTGLFCDIESFAVVDEPLYVYCVNQGATTLVHSPFGMRKTSDSFAIIRQVLDYAKGRDCWKFALRQAADGLASTIGKVYKSRDGDAITELVAQCGRLKREYYDVFAAMPLKAKLRLRLLNRNRWRYTTDCLEGVKLPPLGEIEKLVAADIGAKSVRLRLNRKQGFTSRTYTGELSDGRGVFVKICVENSRSPAVHKACEGLAFIPRIYSSAAFSISGYGVMVMSLLKGRNYPKLENISLAQLESFVRGYMRFSACIQRLRDLTYEGRTYGCPQRDYEAVAAYAERFPECHGALEPLLDIPSCDREFRNLELSVIHNDFNPHNYAFSANGLSAIYDFDALGLGHPAEELLLALGIRYRESSLGFFGRRRLRRYFRRMVELSGISIPEWRMVVNMQRLRWAALFIRSRPHSTRYVPKLVRRDRRSCELLAVLDDMEKTA